MHALASLISSYIGYVGLMSEYPELQERVAAIEATLRAFCLTGELRSAAPTASNDLEAQRREGAKA